MRPASARSTRSPLALGCVGHGPTSNGHTAVHTRRVRRAPNAISRSNRQNRDFSAAAGRLRRSAAARHAGCACSTVGHGSTPLGRFLCSSGVRTQVRKRAGAAGTRVGLVEVGFFGVDFSVWLDAPRAAGPVGNMSGFDPSLGRREMLLRRQRCGASDLNSPRARPTVTRAVPTVTARATLTGESSERRCESPPCSSRAVTDTSSIAWPAALQAGEWECRWERGRTSDGSRGGFGGAPRVQYSPPWTSRGRRSGRQSPAARSDSGSLRQYDCTLSLHTRQPARPEHS